MGYQAMTVGAPKVTLGDLRKYGHMRPADHLTDTPNLLDAGTVIPVKDRKVSLVATQPAVCTLLAELESSYPFLRGPDRPLVPKCLTGRPTADTFRRVPVKRQATLLALGTPGQGLRYGIETTPAIARIPFPQAGFLCRAGRIGVAKLKLRVVPYRRLAPAAGYHHRHIITQVPEPRRLAGRTRPTRDGHTRRVLPLPRTWPRYGTAGRQYSRGS